MLVSVSVCPCMSVFVASFCGRLLVCIGMCWCLLVCIGLCCCLLVCIGLCWCLVVCVGLGVGSLVFLVVYWFVLVCDRLSCWLPRHAYFTEHITVTVGRNTKPSCTTAALLYYGTTSPLIRNLSNTNQLVHY